MVKWTPDLDQVLLIKVLETCEVRPTSKEFENMVKTWPDHLERPTARAISEHLWVIKKSAKATMSDKTAKNGSDKSTPKSTPKKNGSDKSTPKSTPKKNGKTVDKDTPTKTPTKGKGGAEGKRKRMLDEEEEANNEELSDGVEIPMKTEDLDDAFGDGSEMSQTPKKPRAADEAALMYDGSVEAI